MALVLLLPYCCACACPARRSPRPGYHAPLGARHATFCASNTLRPTACRFSVGMLLLLLAVHSVFFALTYAQIKGYNQ